MGVFKKITGNDVRVTPLLVKKLQDVELDPIVGKNFNIIGNPSDPTNFSGSGTTSTSLVYNSVRQLYYSNYISDYNQSESIFVVGTTGSITNLTSDVDGPRGYFYNSPQSSLPGYRLLPLGYEKEIKVFSIPVSTFGESIVPGTLQISGSVVLDENMDGTLISGGVYYGNVFYDNGIIVLTGERGTGLNFGENVLTEGSMSFSSSFTIYSTKYVCTAGPHEFNYSLNPTLRSGSTATEFNSSIVNSPEFMPYVTTVGLYNEYQELIMVGKLSQPTQLNPYTNTNFIINLDR